jgi:hypothetical protein
MTRFPAPRVRTGLAAVVLTSLALVGVAAGPAAAVVTATVAATANFPAVIGQSSPLGDVSITEPSSGFLHAGDVVSLVFADGSSGSTLHFATAGTISGTNGLAATVALASSNSSGTPLLDEMKVTVTATSGSSAFPGVLTLSGLTAAVDNAAPTGNDKVSVSDTQGALGGTQIVADANLVTIGSLRAPYAALATPTIIPTANGQLVGDVAISEPAKAYFHTGDVITFSLRDANGSADTVGLSSSPYAAGGSMTVAVAGVNGPSVQTNDTSFLVNVVAGDPAPGSASTLTVSNLSVNTAEAPLGLVTLAATVTAGPDVGTAIIAPGRVPISSVGGNTNTIAVGQPMLALSTPGQIAGNLAITATPGSIARNDTVSAQIQTSGVTFNAASPPIATVTSGSVVLASATATLSPDDTTASWKVNTGADIGSALAIGPVVLDVSGTPAAGTPVSMLVSAQAGSAFTTQVVSDAVIAAPSAMGHFVAHSAVPSVESAPFTGAQIAYDEPSAGATPVGSVITLVSPYATQIAAFRSTFAATPTVVTTGGLTLAAGHINASAEVVSTPQGTITAPAQSVATFTVTAASTSAGTATFSAPTFALGDLVAPGALVVQGVVESSGALTSNLGGNQLVDEVVTRNLGTSAATTPPTVTLTQQPPLVSNSANATFAFTADQYGATFACALDATVVSLSCPSPITLPSLAPGSHTFTVQAFNLAGFGGTPVNYTWSIDNTAPTATASAPSTLSGPLTVHFSEPVVNIAADTVTLSLVPSSGPTTPITTTLTCVNALSAKETCSPVTAYQTLLVQPSAALVPGEHYQLALNPATADTPITDLAANALAATLLNFRGGLSVEESSVASSETWSVVHAAGAPGGTYAAAHLVGESASFSFTGTQVAWKTLTGPSQGYATVTIDGKLVATVNGYATATHYGVAHAYGGLASSAHTIKITVKGVRGAAKATDDAVSVNQFVVGSTVTAATSPLITFSWLIAGAGAASGGHYAAEELAGASFTLHFRGTAVTWYSITGPTMGQATVYVDGVSKGIVSQYAAKLTYHTARTFGSLSDADHTLTIVVLGRHVAASTGSRVAVDAFKIT